ncbi:MAG: hypothetical protein OXG05_09960 [Gammaproteobacteria bacterium]|nr:hypothetical protein [Gammaproteobacteria bacterium]
MMTLFSRFSKRPIQLGMVFALLSTTLILPPSLLPDLVAKNTTAQAFIVGCDYTFIGIGGDSDNFTWPPRDSDGDGAPDCWDPCPLDPDPLCGLVDYGALCKAMASFMGAMGLWGTRAPHPAGKAAGVALELSGVAMAEFCRRKYDG